MQPLQITKAQWLSAQYLSDITQGNKGFFFSGEEYQLYECETNESKPTKLHVIGQSINAEKLWRVSQSFSHALKISCFFPRVSEFGLSFIASVSLNESIPVSTLNDVIETVATKLNLDLILLNEAPKLTKPGLLVMDMDSTVIQVECIDEIAKLAGVGEQVSQVTALAMQGKLDFAESLTQRVGCLKGTSLDVLEQVCDSLPLMPGLENLVTNLQTAGWKIAIASGGFTFFADYLKGRLNLDAAVSNALEIESGCLTGRVAGKVVDAHVKAETLVSLAKQFGIEKSQTIAMGDGANDLVMMEEAALGVGCHAKPVVREKADCSIRYAGLDALLALLDD